MKTVVVVGAGRAGLSAGVELRRRGWDGRLVFVGAEKHRPYQRPPLSKDYLLTDAPPSARLTEADSLDAEWQLGRAATGLDLDTRTVVLDAGDRLRFDGMVIATGVIPNPVPSAWGASPVHTVRDLEDAAVLRGRLKRSHRVLVIGGGFLGSEVAATCAQRGKSVVLVERHAQPLHTAAGPWVGRRVGRMHHSHGVDLRVGRKVVAMSGTTEVRATLDDSSVISADLVVAAHGARPATRWLHGSGLTLDGAVLLGKDGLAAPGIAAAGDVALAPHPLLAGERVRVEHYAHASAQGVIAGGSLLGAASRQRAPLPSFWSDLYDQRLRSVGFTGARFDFRLVDHDPTTSSFLGEYRLRGRLVGAITNGGARRLFDYSRRLQEEYS